MTEKSFSNGREPWIVMQHIVSAERVSVMFTEHQNSLSDLGLMFCH